MTFRLSQQSLDRLNGVHEDLEKVVLKAIQITKVDFGVLEGLRTVNRQKQLYAQGRTTPGQIVTWTMKSEHLTGRAVDLGAYVDGRYIDGDNSNELKLYDQIADAMLGAAASLNVPLIWGVGKLINGRPEKDFGHFNLNPKFYEYDKRKEIT